MGIGLFFVFMGFNIDTPVLRWLGSISYPLYLIHVPVRQIIVDLIPSEGEVATAMLGILVTLILATIMHHVVERPFGNAGKSVIARLRAPRPTTDASVISVD